MIARFLADLVAVAHFAFILFALLGGLLALRWRWIMWLHLPAATWGALIEFFGWYCPLTPLENWLRREGGEAGYPGGFVERYLLPVIYPGALTREIQVIIGVFVVVLNVVIYWVVWRRARAT